MPGFSPYLERLNCQLSALDERLEGRQKPLSTMEFAEVQAPSNPSQFIPSSASSTSSSFIQERAQRKHSQRQNVPSPHHECLHSFLTRRLALSGDFPHVNCRVSGESLFFVPRMLQLCSKEQFKHTHVTSMLKGPQLGSRTRTGGTQCSVVVFFR